MRAIIFFLTGFLFFCIHATSQNNSVLSTKDWREILDNAQMSALTYNHYNAGLQPRVTINGNANYRILEQDYDIYTGLNYTLFERFENGKREWTVSFAGTSVERKWHDWFSFNSKDATTDLFQGATNPQLSSQYRKSADIAQRIHQKAQQEGITLKFTGHSLGGGLAQFASLYTGCEAVVFNAAPLGIHTFSNNFWNGLKALPRVFGINFQSENERQIQAQYRKTITHVDVSGDLVHLLPGHQIGQEIKVNFIDESGNIGNPNRRYLFSGLRRPTTLFPLFADVAEFHSMESVIRSIRYEIARSENGVREHNAHKYPAAFEIDLPSPKPPHPENRRILSTAPQAHALAAPPPPPPPPSPSLNGVNLSMPIDSNSSFKKDPQLRKLKESVLQQSAYPKQ